MNPADLYHLGIVVDDLDATLDELSRTLGYRWGIVVEADSPIRVGGEQQTLHSRFAYSKDEPRLEIIQALPGSAIWTAGAAVHHMGYWTDDVATEVARLAGAGCTEEVTGLGPDGSPMWAYVRGPVGRIELVDRRLEAGLSQTWR